MSRPLSVIAAAVLILCSVSAFGADCVNPIASIGFQDGRTGAPILDQAVAYVDCEVRHDLALGDRCGDARTRF